MKLRAFALIVTLTLGLLAAPFAADAQRRDRRSPYWPTEDWRSSTPEEQGVDSERLAAMFEEIQNRRLNLCSVLIIRNGYMVVEAYFGNCRKTKLIRISSVTKSITSALVGIALDKGYIDGVHQGILDFFPEKTVSNPDLRKQAMTLEHLLTMTTGLNWPEFPNGVAQLKASQDWVQFVLDRPMTDEPGTKWNYNTGASHLLSAIIQRTTRMTALSFAEQHLFGPLGISDVVWLSDPQGISNAGWGLRMTSRHMAKFGYLYLNHGMWGEKRVVPEEWVKVSTKKHAQPPSSVRRDVDGYGYQWWTNSGPPYRYVALGFAGQVIWVSPALQMLAVLTGYWNYPDELGPLVRNIIRAARSSGPLLENSHGVELLESRIKELRRHIPFREREPWRGPYRHRSANRP
ncbi:MAG: serine hydrolase domain-containing protein [Nitrospiraceae bacterium]